MPLATKFGMVLIELVLPLITTESILSETTPVKSEWFFRHRH